MVVEREARRRPIANAPRREPGETTPAAHRSRGKAECKRCAARTGEPNPFWERCRPVELSVGELQLDLHIHPTLKLYPVATEGYDAEPGDVDLFLDDGDGAIGLAMSAAEARLLAHQLLQASAEHEWLVEQGRGRLALVARRELSALDEAGLREQLRLLQRQAARLDEDSCELIGAGDGGALAYRISDARKAVQAELERRKLTPDPNGAPAHADGDGWEPEGIGDW